MTISKAQAETIAREYVARASEDTGTTWVLLEELTRDCRFGWVFFYDTKAYVDTGDQMQAGVGNAPLIIDRHTGKLHVTGTAYPVDHYIAVYERDGHLQRAHG